MTRGEKLISTGAAAAVIVAGYVALTAENEIREVKIPEGDNTIEPVTVDEYGCIEKTEQLITPDYMEQLNATPQQIADMEDGVVLYDFSEVEDVCELIDQFESSVAKGDRLITDTTVVEAPFSMSTTEFVIFDFVDMNPNESVSFPAESTVVAVVDAYSRRVLDEGDYYEFSSEDIDFLTNQLASARSFNQHALQVPGEERVATITTVSAREVGLIFDCMQKLTLPETRNHCANT